MNSIIFDFDGTLYVWDPTKTLEDVGKADYPLTQDHMWPMLYAAQRINNEYPGMEKIASAVLNDGCMRSKIRRISRDIGSDVANRSVFTVFGESKADKVATEGTKKVGIKVYNGINGNHGTWTGFSVRATAEPEICYKQLKAIIDSVIAEYKDGVDILISDFSKELIEWEAA